VTGAPLEAADLEALRKAAGDDAVVGGAPVEVDGTRLETTVRPPGAEALAATVRTLAERRLPALVRGGGSRIGLGNPPRGARLVLSTQGLSALRTLDPAEGVLCAEGGATLAGLRDALEGTAWELPFDPPGARTTLGGTLASGAVGPRHPGFGRPRDLVLGLAVVHGDGLRARAGGRVVKNVTGYDLMKLHVGSLGTLGVIESAWIRLRPRPARALVLSASLGDGPDACARALAAARRPSVRAAALVDARLAPAVEPSAAPATGFLLVVELAGDEPAVASDAAALGATHGAHDASPGALSRVRALQGETFGPVGLRFRLAVLPDRLDVVSGALEATGGALLVYPGSGLVHARFALEPELDAAGVDRIWRAVERAARAGEGFAVLEAAPPFAKAVRDVYGDAPGEARLWRALKQRFDPAGVLNPGRFAAGL
jgi:glycolate oxidase FAD binding subunit